MEKGTINVQTENIFPIIKRYLYSDQEIFLRELVSNAVDATQKLKTLSLRGEVKGELGELLIEVAVDKAAKTLTISDRGIGMTKEEVEKYITQIAFSSAQEFLDKYKDSEQAIIGHFGLGFFSAFMVADKVEIQTNSWREDAQAVRWICDGSTEYEIGEGDRATRGTDIILHVGEEAAEYLEDSKIEELLTKYCRFLPVEIKFGTKTQTIPAPEPKEGEEAEEPQTFEVDNIINDPKPAWTKKPNELEQEDYIAFYRQLYPYAPEPLFWIHLNVDYPFNLTGILYFPKTKNQNFEVRKDRIHLYCNQVFVTDQLEQIVPDFLMMLHGVIDSPDIPLNVSRSYLQSDPEVKKINKYISKKVADKLGELFKNDRQNYEEKWEHINILVKYGMITDDKFFTRTQKICLVEDVDGKLYTVEEFTEAVKEQQTNKNGETVFLYATGDEDQHAFIQSAKDRGYKVLKFDTILDPHFINHMEPKLEKVTFKRVDADTIDNLIEKEDKIESALTDEQQTTVKEMFNGVITSESAIVEIKAMSPTDRPVLITRPEFMRRMKDMGNIGGGSPYGQMPDMYHVLINGNHPTVNSLLNEETAQEAKDQLAKQLYDLALLQQNMLKGADLTNFINRSIELMK